MLTKLRVSALAAALLTALAATAPALADVQIHIDKATQRMTVKVDGAVRYAWPVSTGRAGYSTPAGSYTPFRLEEDHYSKEWDDAPMPHSIFFTKVGHAIHGSYETKRLGTPASHGCVRLAPAHAATLFALVKAEGLPNTKVVISGEDQMIAKRRPAPRDPEPMVLSGDAYARAETYERPQLDDYALQMRRRYYEERVPQAYDDRLPRRLYVSPYEAPRGYAPRVMYPYGWN